MNLTEIAVKNILRRKAKALFVLAGISIGVATLVAVMSFTEAMTGDINHKLERYGANILITPKTETLSLSYGGVSLGGVSFEMEEIREEELSRIENIENAANIAAAGPVVIGITEIKDRPVILAGIDFKAVEILKPWWKIDGRIPDAGGVLLGAEAARLLQLAREDVVFIKGNAFQVTGILNQTGSQDDQLIFTTLPVAQEIHNKTGRISMVEVAALCEGCPIPEMVKQLSEALPGARVTAIQQVVKSRHETIDRLKTFSMGISLVVLLVGSLVVLVTMMSNIRERTDEIGIFRAVGFRKTHIIKIVLIEACLVSTLAGLIGYIAGEGGARTIALFVKTHEHMAPLNWHLAGTAVLLAIIIGACASFYPAVTASRMDPAVALKTI